MELTDYTDYLPFWKQLTPIQQQQIQKEITFRQAPKGTLLYGGLEECLGLILIRSGQLRAFLLSQDGREITLYRLLDRDVCLFSASCILHSIQFDITIEAEKDTEFWLIPPGVYKKITEESAAAANYTNELMSSRFSEVMWLMEQIMWKSFDKRLAEFLLSECDLEGSSLLAVTHEKIANHLGTAREVVTRMLRYFQSEGFVKLSRGTVEVTDSKSLKELTET